MDGEVQGAPPAEEMVVGVVLLLLDPDRELGGVVDIGEAIRTQRLVIEVEEDEREQTSASGRAAGIGIEIEIETVTEWTGVFRLLDANHHLRGVEEAGVTDEVEGIGFPFHGRALVPGLHRGGDDKEE